MHFFKQNIRKCPTWKFIWKRRQFENVEEKKIQTICNKAYFKKRAIFKAKLQFYQTLDYILKI
jgi:hypothetical protein